ncbi:UNVERIFIED_CONTAM: hypothetical protein Slati_4427700 [Sesamum latifolium]|uniref:Uncharacterized protein n=1 Tax=Sesamum latifolium TaxID=2727402 RepID=A0AAW2SQ56_9LAMI
MDKEGSSPARESRDCWLSDQVAGARSLAQRSGRGCQVAGSAISDLHELNSAVSIR